jgi:hypothetical protein
MSSIECFFFFAPSHPFVSLSFFPSRAAVNHFRPLIFLFLRFKIRAVMGAAVYKVPVITANRFSLTNLSAAHI